MMRRLGSARGDGSVPETAHTFPPCNTGQFSFHTDLVVVDAARMAIPKIAATTAYATAGTEKYRKGLPASTQPSQPVGKPDTDGQCKQRRRGCDVPENLGLRLGEHCEQGGGSEQAEQGHGAAAAIGPEERNRRPAGSKAESGSNLMAKVQK